MTSALDEDGNVQTAEFSGGRFMVRQSAAGDGMVDIYLKGSIGRCRAGAARLASDVGQEAPGRRLWGRDRNGRFRTHGNDSVASVRGTRWLTEDTCAGTRTRVTEGSVAVRDLHRKRTIVVRAGHCLPRRAAPAEPRRSCHAPGMADDLPIHVDDVPVAPLGLRRDRRDAAAARRARPAPSVSASR